jgi:taurine dioxygenase
LSDPAVMASPFELQPLTPRLGARVIGLDLAADLSSEAFAALYQAFLQHKVLVFAPLDLPPAAQVAFARRFGEVQVHVMSVYHADGFPELYRLSNLDEQGRPSGKHPDKGTMAWHTDGSWQRLTGQATIIYGEQVPPIGGETHFCDMAGAYERLDAGWKRRIAGLRAVHNLDFSRTRRHAEDPLSEAQRLAKPPVDHPVVRVHPETGQRCLYLGDHAESIVGLPYDEGRALIEELNALAVSHADLRYEHRWQPHELIVWDNRSLVHRATAFDTDRHARVVRRCTVLGEAPVGDAEVRAAGQ